MLKYQAFRPILKSYLINTFTAIQFLLPFIPENDAPAAGRG